MVCQWCFKYTVELLPFLKHLKCCSWRQGIPPGERIYTKDGYSLWEIDGEEFKVGISFIQHPLLRLRLVLSCNEKKETRGRKWDRME